MAYVSSNFLKKTLEYSRKNDLVSIIYLLLYLRDGALEWTANLRNLSVKDKFYTIWRRKNRFCLKLPTMKT